MTSTQWTLIEDGEQHQIAGKATDAGVRLATGPTLEALGWSLKPEGLCQGDVCIPTTGQQDLVTEDGIDLSALGELLGRPLALEAAAAAASLGASADTHAAALATGVAPDFTLPDLAGRPHTLSAYRGKKVLLIAYASW